MARTDKVFVTGANGRVGLPLVRRLLADGLTVAGLTRTEAAAHVVRDLGADSIPGDIHSPAALALGAEGTEYVFHLAGGLRGEGRVSADELNHQGTQHLVDAIRKARIPHLKAVIFTSSAAVYGDRSGLWVEEDMPPHPNTDYGRSKAAAEQVLLDSGLPVRIVRLGAVYGPGFPFTLADPIRAGRAALPGEGRNFVPTIHITDAVAGLIAVMKRGENGRIYNLSDPNPIPLADFYAEVHRHVGGRPVRFWSTWIPSHVQQRVARLNEHISVRLGHTPRFTTDNLALFTASSRMRVDRMEKELDFHWAWPHARDGLASTFAAKA